MTYFGEALSVWWMWLIPAAFIAVLVYAFNPRRKKQFQKDAEIPFDDKPSSSDGKLNK